MGSIAGVKRGPYKKRTRLATGPMDHYRKGELVTFEEFCQEQQIRLQNGMRPPVPEVFSSSGWAEQGEHPQARLNDGFTRLTLMRDAEVEHRGRV